MPEKIKMLEDQVVWMQFLTKEDVEEVLHSAVTRGVPSPFAVLERWMEALKPVWVRLKDVPLQVWHEYVFRLQGDCLGSTVEVDTATVTKEYSREGRVKVLLNKSGELPAHLTIWVDTLLTW